LNGRPWPFRIFMKRSTIFGSFAKNSRSIGLCIFLLGYRFWAFIFPVGTKTFFKTALGQGCHSSLTVLRLITDQCQRAILNFTPAPPPAQANFTSRGECSPLRSPPGVNSLYCLEEWRGEQRI
jgi:hypothetical protein